MNTAMSSQTQTFRKGSKVYKHFITDLEVNGYQFWDGYNWSNFPSFSQEDLGSDKWILRDYGFGTGKVLVSQFGHEIKPCKAS